ncbi:hypothetical protein CSB20_11490 [bacterium DOLZORAL124_64_63]|nr:MAG: hypothetical protein CSB20_11490 [bacterium DOLZORAL124_64_63]
MRPFLFSFSLTILALVSALALPLTLAGCGGEEPRPELVARAVLPADTIEPGPPVGRELAPVINGRRMPMDGFPVQGFSAVLPGANGELLVLQDNGFGSRANSPAFPLHWFRLGVDWGAEKGQPGKVELREVVRLTDPSHLIPGTPPDGLLTGAHLDPESFVRAPDGTIWVGEEFGPFLVHFSADGQVLETPIPLPLPADMAPYGRNLTTLMSPDHPELRHQADGPQLANLPRSGGVEGLALAGDGKTLYVAIEKGLVEDPDRRRRILLEFDLDSGTFADRFHRYEVDAADVSIAALESAGPGRLLLTERDRKEGEAAIIKRVYRVDLGTRDERGCLQKHLVCDLLNMADPRGLTRAESGAVGLGADFQFPFVTPECLMLLDPRTLLLINDNNYPMSTGRRPGLPDDSEFIQVRLAESVAP